MNKVRFFRTLIGVTLLAQAVCAQTTPLTSNSNPKIRTEEKNEPQVTPYMRDSIPPLALQNILESELAFCYTVDSAAKDYKGYTMDGLAVTGFCGVLPQIEKDIFIKEYLSNEHNVSPVSSTCYIRPRLMLRFIRGVDYVDVLYSLPCPSFTVFYGGKIKSFNAAPSENILTAIIDAYEKQKADFVSPALIGQVLPIGIPQNDEQKKIIRDKQTQKPIRNWSKNTEKSQPIAEEQSPEPTPKKGWNNLKFNKTN